ncbi:MULTISPECIES: LysR family transcriptional regulator [unclassified Rhizobacter]|uniref:LysR family transcriptional regulator n=1 Tax=unclassified Rhizobacter TaxID=2640088 RepID=UPI0006F45B4A|nr:MULTISPECIES: LysR family transcriptional regulator [unclassified Rhizobacter]KQU76937.1 LysR family transcriptional regulator [Rhizobacter sp. Root29]KQV97458.1 LysR family transcriptional regulator [Rhizobacter sp. Root1238]KRB10129.1 LysR family transcriptional regulator [Rhizobacter sp. Root16D2]
MTSKIGWELYRSFLGVLEEGSLSGAARALGITQPTVGRHVAALEQALGVVLFTRSQTGLLPTEAARSLQPYAEAMQSTAAALERAAGGQGGGDGAVKGTVRISCADIIGVEVLPPMLAGLHEAHPQLKIELVLTDKLQDLLRREADIAVRMVQPKQEQLIARHIGSIELGLHAHRDYLERRGTPRRPEDLAGHATIGYDQPSAWVRQAEKALHGMRRETFTLRSDSNLAQLALIRAGAGIGMCQVPLARRDANLVRLLPKLIALPLGTWVTMHEDLRSSPRCRVAFDALVAGLTDYIDPKRTPSQTAR